MLNSNAGRSTLVAALVVVGFGPGCSGGEDREAPPATVSILPQPVPEPSKNPAKALPGSGQGSGSQPDPNVGP